MSAYSNSKRIVLVAGPVKPRDRSGHHDYAGGCRLLAGLLARIPGVTAELVTDGWPDDPALLEGAAALVFYDKGGGRQGFLASPQRVEQLQHAAGAGAGLVMIHQTVGFPADHFELGTRLLGGAYASGTSRRGHWRSEHKDFPEHPITRGVTPWRIRDGWLNGIVFNEGMHGITPLLWSGRRYGGSPDGGEADVVAWAYERPDTWAGPRSSSGRSFVFTGLDAHSAWSHAGLRRLMVNGILWCAGVEVPGDGAPVDVDEATLQACLTPRGSMLAGLPRKAWRRLAGAARW
jgi:hypothetical protein